MKILAIESSCDETAAAVIEDGTTVLSSIISSSSAMHETWGGIVPEVAAREQLASIIPVIMDTLSIFIPEADRKSIPYKPVIEKNIDAIAVTIGPGLIGSLLIGVESAKTIAFATGKPIIPVNHVLAHMYANFVNQKTPIEFPAISLVVSGGHTELFVLTSPKDITWIGGTIDDAAGEAFDKSARLLGFGSRGGLAIQEAANKMTQKEKHEIILPRPLLHDKTLNFSFSGLKTAIQREWNKTEDKSPEKVALFAFEVQEAITDVLVAKTLQAAEIHNAKSILLGGGVAANLKLREKFESKIQNRSFHVPPISLCTDNAVYIGSYAYFRGTPVDWHIIEATPNLSVEV